MNSTINNNTDMRLLQLLSQTFPNSESASTEIINLEAILNLPKGTEHFVADIHGEHEAFLHILRNASGNIKRKVHDLFEGSLPERICTASSAAFSAPLMATVATGMPEGICTVDSRLSRPSMVLDLTGTPMTGSTVLAASTPARCAALPAAAMMTPAPCSSAVLLSSSAAAGVR